MPEPAATSITLSVQVHPRSRQEKLAFQGDVLHAWVAAPPVEGAANDALIALLAKTLGVPRRNVTLERGAAARHKRIVVQGVTLEQVKQKIGTTRSSISQDRLV